MWVWDLGKKGSGKPRESDWKVLCCVVLCSHCLRGSAVIGVHALLTPTLCHFSLITLETLKLLWSISCHVDANHLWELYNNAVAHQMWNCPLMAFMFMQRYSCRPTISKNGWSLSCGNGSNLENIEKEIIYGCQKDKHLHLQVLQRVTASFPFNISQHIQCFAGYWEMNFHLFFLKMHQLILYTVLKIDEISVLWNILLIWIIEK